MSSMANVLKPEKRAAIIAALVEGNGVRATARMVGVSKDTVSKLQVEIGAACARYQDETLTNLPSKRVQVDEIWSFVYAKARNVPQRLAGRFGVGDVWTFTAIDADSKLCVSWLVGPRDSATATEFLQDVASRLANRVQLTTDGLRTYVDAVERAFGNGVDYAMIEKIYGTSEDHDRRYSPAVCLGAKKSRIQGNPDIKHVSTPYVERQNLTMRMSMRRFTRLTNAFSEKLENHVAAVALHLMYDNFCRIHQTLRVTPAMAAGVAKTPWTVEDLVGLLSRKAN
jgi:IS1 family transposase